MNEAPHRPFRDHGAAVCRRVADFVPGCRAPLHDWIFAMSERPPEQKRNAAETEDIKLIIDRIEEAFATESEEKQAASDKRKRAVKMAYAELKSVGGDEESVKAIIDLNKMDAKRVARVAKIKTSHLEIFDDLHGQLAFLKPDKGEDATKVAVRQRMEAIQAATDRDAAEGNALVNDIIGLNG